MLTRTDMSSGLSKQETGYLAAIADCVREMAAGRKDLKKADAEIRQWRAASRRKLAETWGIIHRVQATL